MEKLDVRMLRGPGELLTTFVPGLAVNAMLTICFPPLEVWLRQRIQHPAPLDFALFLATCYVTGQVLHTLSDSLLQRGLLCRTWGFPVYQLLGGRLSSTRRWWRHLPGRRQAYSPGFTERLLHLAEQRCAFKMTGPPSANVARDFYWFVSLYVSRVMPDTFRTAKRLIEQYGFARNMALAALVISLFATCPGWEWPVLQGSGPLHRLVWVIGWWMLAAIMYVNYTHWLYRQNDFVLRAFATQHPHGDGAIEPSAKSVA